MGREHRGVHRVSLAHCSGSACGHGFGERLPYAMPNPTPNKWEMPSGQPLQAVTRMHTCHTCPESEWAMSCGVPVGWPAGTGSRGQRVKSDLSSTRTAWAELKAALTDSAPCCTLVRTSFDIPCPRYCLDPFHLGFSGISVLFSCVPALASILSFGHGFSGLLAALRIPLARLSSSDCLAPLALSVT